LRAIGWGREGHHIVAEIAQRRLTEAAEEEVRRLSLRTHFRLLLDKANPCFSAPSLASFANWADDEIAKRPNTILQNTIQPYPVRYLESLVRMTSKYGRS
jgi:hypothetical protein